MINSGPQFGHVDPGPVTQPPYGGNQIDANELLEYFESGVVSERGTFAEFHDGVGAFDPVAVLPRHEGWIGRQIHGVVAIHLPHR